MSPPYPVYPPLAEPKGINLVNIFQIGPEIGEGGVFQSFVRISCMHCVDAPCIMSCPTSAIYKDSETNITLVNRERCIGCKSCLWVCPFGAPSFDEEGKLVLCDMCIDRIKEGKKAACEAACPACAIITATAEEIAEIQAKKASKRIAQA
jgi:Fe-S-cluster-containing dehydrogenase component